LYTTRAAVEKPASFAINIFSGLGKKREKQHSNWGLGTASLYPRANHKASTGETTEWGENLGKMGQLKKKENIKAKGKGMKSVNWLGFRPR